MANLIVENRVCPVCGTDVRSGSLFCYHCGDSVESKPKPEIIEEKNNASQINFRAAADNNGNDLTVSKPEEVEIKTRSVIVENAAEKIVSENPSAVEETKIEKNVVVEQAKLQSAASLRRKSKVVQRKKVEVVWEEHENAPNAWFIIVAVILTALAAGIIYLAMRLR